MPVDVSVPVTADDIERWKGAIEDENLEFKTAENNFHYEKLVRYCCALANEGGGRIVLGMSPTRPRSVGGTTALANIENTRSDLIRDLGISIRADEVPHPDITRRGARVVVFSAASRDKGNPVSYKSEFWARSGEELVPLDASRLREIFNELAHDFSAQICPGATTEHLDPDAIETLRRLWHCKSKNTQLLGLSHDQLLRDAELVDEEGVTYAALLLLGTPRAMSKYLAQAEVIWEYRVNEASIGYDKRQEFRSGFLVFHDEIWKTANERNYAQPVQRGFVMVDVPPFNERATREAIANAVIHRDYRLQDSTFVKQSAHALLVKSPGGLPHGITLGNILNEHSARNRRVAEVAQKCGLIERSGQGVDLMFQLAVREGKELPDYSQTSASSVSVTTHGIVQDPKFLLFTERVGDRMLEEFSTQDFLALDAVNRNLRLDDALKPRAQALSERGLLEKVGHGKGRRFILSRELCEAGGSPAIYTRVKGLGHDARKQLLLQHIRDFNHKGCTLAELRQVEPALSGHQARGILKELKREGTIEFRGSTRWGRWFLSG